MLDWLLEHWIVTTVIAIVVVWRVLRRVRRRLRRSRPVRLHPKLQKYAGPQRIAADRRREADKIIATSTAAEIAGYRIVEQVEAVFVDGFLRPEEAMEGLKAAAAMKGANALSNVRQERSSAGRYSAGGDAVKVVRSGDETEADPSETPV